MIGYFLEIHKVARFNKKKELMKMSKKLKETMSFPLPPQVSECPPK
jgi:hypothetical protein